MTGEIGESLANVFLSRRTSQGHLFRTAMIGGKWPTIDIYAEVISNNPEKMFCFFQIKATELGYTQRQHKLRISVDLQDLIRLSNFSAPTYIIGIDHNPAQPFLSNAYIGTIRGNYTRRLSSLPTPYALNDANLVALRAEVIAYWTALNPTATKTNYLTNFTI